ncbi:UNVERIFIED_CONTAM: hypothetical protein HDU68_005832 [Siphonaria sp. JEL0065]|nr:hypothetical protein HDU68_005832 [Siphonaria sp. JEL0065]
MNILLFAPAFALLMFQSVGLLESIKNGIIAIAIQVALAVPFIVAGFGESYFSKAFEFSRQFFFVWTVNWRFVGEDVFVSKEFALGLVGLHLGVLVLFLGKWVGSFGGILNVIKKGVTSTETRVLDADCMFVNPSNISRAEVTYYIDILLTMFTSNLIGITFARSLHYQFYSWYFYTIPYLLFRTQIPLLFKLSLFLFVGPVDHF